jgi:hypothetical protein
MNPFVKKGDSSVAAGTPFVKKIGPTNQPGSEEMAPMMRPPIRGRDEMGHPFVRVFRDHSTPLPDLSKSETAVVECLEFPNELGVFDDDGCLVVANTGIGEMVLTPMLAVQLAGALIEVATPWLALSAGGSEHAQSAAGRLS